MLSSIGCLYVLSSRTICVLSRLHPKPGSLIQNIYGVRKAVLRFCWIIEIGNAGKTEVAGLEWFKNGLFWVTQTIGILPPGKGDFDTAMKKTGRVSNPFRVQLKGAETA
jgi:hypothetical protein